ncbi:MAG: response regulator transcription factor [Saprospiraceae bacterium]|nr:response regulator transcription factor [Saprospiraceae bacterium]
MLKKRLDIFRGMLSGFLENRNLLPLLVLPFLAWMVIPDGERDTLGFSPENMNLALRRTADRLLRESGDSTSRIPSVEQTGETTWRLRMERPFDYKRLPALLQASLDMHGITQPYEVRVRQCISSVIDLGYHQRDVLDTNAVVACDGREMPNGCHYIEVAFTGTKKAGNYFLVKAGVIAMALLVLAGFWYNGRQHKTMPASNTQEPHWLVFGNSQLDADNQILQCSELRQNLTFRETKLLQLFAANPDKLLERDFILQEVWANEGILVGRSIDVFVSRLRKKLQTDPTVTISVVHGVGYRLEVNKPA